MSQKNPWLCATLAALFGLFGIHRFYVGRYSSGFLQLLTFGGLGFWSLFDLYLIYFGKFKDSKGLVLGQLFDFKGLS